jgi:hypothetical protein
MRASALALSLALAASSATAQQGMFPSAFAFPTPGRVFQAAVATFSTVPAADISIPLSAPVPGTWAIVRGMLSNCTGTGDGTFKASFSVGAGGTGDIYLGSPTTAYLTGISNATQARIVSANAAPNTINYQVTYSTQSPGNINFSVTTAAATSFSCDVTLYGEYK